MANPTDPSSPDKNRTRSVGELLQLLGTTNAFEVKVEEAAPPKDDAGPFEVHAATEARLNWKPEFFAVSKDGKLRIPVSRVEAEALLNAGAPQPPP